ncbi:hypothetical protein HGB07_05575 [Candidatus Roizmanbacteria bacterium]|nr:hypothetical protein [Candidatus Roizmanbacteria bacterium]
MPTKKSKSTKKNVSKRAVKTEETVQENETVQEAKKPSALRKVTKKQLGIFVALVAIIAVLYAAKSYILVATVNGEPISRFEVVGKLEKQYGKSIMTSIVTQKLLAQEANKRHITVSDKEVNDEIKRISDSFAARGQKLNDLMKAQGVTRADLVSQIKLQKSVEKMFAKDIKVTDEDVAKFVEQNKAQIPTGMSEAEVKKEAYEQLRQDALNEKTQTLIQTLNKNAKINYFIKY